MSDSKLLLNVIMFLMLPLIIISSGVAKILFSICFYGIFALWWFDDDHNYIMKGIQNKG